MAEALLRSGGPAGGTLGTLLPTSWARLLASFGERGSRAGTEGDPARASRYAAFISYRHVEPDREWAEWLHGALETYRVPKRLARERGLPRKIGRVFRDEEELPASPRLSAEIENALRRSEYLIVVCSPRALERPWVNAEVEFFRSLGRGDKILALLIEGEPSTSFPPSLLEIRPDAAASGSSPLPDGDQPLAADVRSVTSESERRRKRTAQLKLLAPILGCRFDDLRQREQQRRARNLRYPSVFLTGLLLFAGGLAGWAEVNRRSAVEQRDRALISQSRFLADQSQQ